MLAIVIITYNSDKFLRRQVERIQQHCKDEYQIIVVDNSSDNNVIQNIKYYCSLFPCIRIKTSSSSQGGSNSHAFAANVSYLQLKDKYDHFLYLDHDCFPIKDFSVAEILSDKVMAGIGQEKSKTYLWPGCLMFIKGLDIDFSTNHAFGLDTGGNLYKIIEQYPNDIIYFDEVKEENPEFNKNMYNFYSLINDGMFMHFINGSGWNKVGDQEERVNSLLNILKKK